MQSMTGFGRGTATCDGRELIIELKSVNHRFLDITYKAPRALAAYEEYFKQLAAQYFSRGHIDVYVTYRNTRTDAKTVALDTALLHGYMEAFQQAQGLGVNGCLSVEALLSMPDVLTVTAADEDEAALKQLFTLAGGNACKELNKMRGIEGEKLYADLLLKLNRIDGIRQSISKLADGVSAELMQKMRLRISELLEDVPVDEQRLAQEIAISADRLAIDEELVRLKAHIDNARNYLQANEPVGRKFEFILQEINRETNTIGSKAMNVEIQTLVVEIKGELEKLREQVQNVE